MQFVIPKTIRVLLPDGTVRRLGLENYIAGVVAAVLPADAPLEAMKAQAVAARTFAANTRRHVEQGAEVCAQRHCQAWRPQPPRAALQAARETQGLVAVYGSRLIDAYYFDHCDGSTRDAAGVLVQPPAYLRSVSCACGFATLKGHGIGMCQRGALVMARFGDSFETILKHYYTGIALVEAAVGPATTQPQETHDSQALPAAAEEPVRKRQERPVEKAPRPAPRARPHVPPTAPAAPPPFLSPAPLEPERHPVSTGAAAPAPEPPAPASNLDASERPSEAEQVPAVSAGQPVEPEAEAVVPEAPAPVEPPPLFEEPPASAPVQPALSLDAIEEPTWYPVGGEVVTAGDLAEAEQIDEALEAEERYVEAPRAVRSRPPGFERAGVAPPLALPPLPPDSMPEEMPVFPIAAPEPAPPPPPLEEVIEASAERAAPSILVDCLPGPRVIAGDLTRSGVIVTIRDAAGHAVITVSGAARQHGPGGFEAALPDAGRYSVAFEQEAFEVELGDETVFITHAA